MKKLEPKVLHQRMDWTFELVAGPEAQPTEKIEIAGTLIWNAKEKTPLTFLEKNSKRVWRHVQQKGKTEEEKKKVEK